MSRAAPGVFARGKLRRNLPVVCRESVRNHDRGWSKRPYRQRMGSGLHPLQNESTKCSSFTLHLSGNRVGCGRVGEVVSLVGDCRPPPPGNPRRPTKLNKPGEWVVSKQTDSRKKGKKVTCFSSKMRDSGGVSSLLCVGSSFNYCLNLWNLKIFKSNEYFKINCSSFYCSWRKPVLEFVHLHSHLCGLTGVKPLSIAITDVLEM